MMGMMVRLAEKMKKTLRKMRKRIWKNLESLGVDGENEQENMLNYVEPISIRISPYAFPLIQPVSYGYHPPFASIWGDSGSHGWRSMLRVPGRLLVLRWDRILLSIPRLLYGKLA